MNREQLETELQFKTSRSGGAGGQNVNKVSTKVELLFDVAGSQFLEEEEKQLISEKLAARISNAGMLQVVSQSERTQPGNKRVAVQRFFELIEKAFEVQKPRKATRISKSQKEKRLVAKQRRSEVKKLRAKDF